MAKDSRKNKKPKPGRSKNCAASSLAVNPSTSAEKAAHSSIYQDERFQKLLKDPLYKPIHQKTRKTVIDDRFKGMFTDKNFTTLAAPIDKYGRRVLESSTNLMQKFYKQESSDNDDDERVKGAAAASASDGASDGQDEDQERRAEEKAISRLSDEERAAQESDDDNEEIPEGVKKRLFDPAVDYARGEGRLISDSSSEEESTDDEEGVEAGVKLDGVWDHIHPDTEMTDESTRRLALCNMNWDRIRAVDLLVLLSSFAPTGGSVESVKIYMSDVGKKCIAEEQRHGPTKLLAQLAEKSAKSADADSESDSDSDDDVDEDGLPKPQGSDLEEGAEFDNEQLRRYQLKRLQYYYAIIECDSVATADKIYKECDGHEYESSGIFIDLRFVPDDTTFDEQPSDTCNQMPDEKQYKPREFKTAALQHSKVELTWDEDEVDRTELIEELKNNDLDTISNDKWRLLIASSSSEDEEELEEASTSSQAAQRPKKPTATERIQAYRALLNEIDEEQQVFDKQVTFEVPEENTKAETETKPAKTSKLTPIEYAEQKSNERKQKRKDRKKQLAKASKGSNADSDSDEDSIPEGVDMNDPYFAEEFQDGEFTAPKTNSKNKKNKKKSAAGRSDDNDEEEARRTKELELLLEDDELAESGKKHFSLEKILKDEQSTGAASRRKRRKQLKKTRTEIAEAKAAAAADNKDDFKLDIDDPRFSAIFKSAEYNVDPTHSGFKKTKGMEQIIDAKIKRYAEEPAENSAPKAKRRQKEFKHAALVNKLKSVI